MKFETRNPGENADQIKTFGIVFGVFGGLFLLMLLLYCALMLANNQWVSSVMDALGGVQTRINANMEKTYETMTRRMAAKSKVTPTLQSPLKPLSLDQSMKQNEERDAAEFAKKREDETKNQTFSYENPVFKELHTKKRPTSTPILTPKRRIIDTEDEDDDTPAPAPTVFPATDPAIRAVRNEALRNGTLSRLKPSAYLASEMERNINIGQQKGGSNTLHTFVTRRWYPRNSTRRHI